MTLQTEPSRQYFTKSCKKITTHATITNGYIPLVFTIDITDETYMSVMYIEF
jgi:hypothetical protein